MHKFPLPLGHDIRPEPRRSKIVRIAFILVLGLGLAPPLEEAASICVANWFQLIGTNTEVRTPILDAVHDGLDTAHESVCSWMSPQFHRLPWNPSFVLPIAAGIMVLGMLMM